MPILVEMEPAYWQVQLDRGEQWFGNLLTAQIAFRQHAEDTVGKIREPHIKEAVAQVAESAREHERQIDELYRVIGRDPSAMRRTAGELMARVGEAVGSLQGALGGAVGAWRDIHRLTLANLNALGAFAVAEQLGFALGYPAIPEITFPIIHMKQTQQLLLQEYMLEMASVEILYQQPI
jgi:hypothetical protein